jgi:hypothetical protein
MKPDYEILPHHCPQSLPNASKDEGTQFAGGGSWMLEVHNSDFTVLETVGCDGHHISPTRQQLERESRVAGEAMKAPPDNLHATRVRESETVGCDYYHNRADIGPRSNLKPFALSGNQTRAVCIPSLNLGP